MESNSVETVKKLWNYLRLTLLYMAKRNLKKRCKLISSTLANLLNLPNHHFKSKKHVYEPSITLKDYEFSCCSSPNPTLIQLRSQIRSRFFSCIRGGSTYDGDFFSSRSGVYESTKCLVPASPFVDYKSEEEEEEGNGLGLGFGSDVDYRAEKFIKRFYQQLRAQSLTANSCIC